MADKLEYNGYEFPKESHVTVSTSMVYDESGRTVTFNRYLIRVSWLVAPYAGSDNAGPHNWNVQQRLSKAGQRLVLEHDGFGPRLAVNYLTAGGLRDVEFGPKPRIIEWNPIGHTGAAEAVWECEVSIAVCNGDGNVRSSGVAALNYAMRYAINERGYTTRTIAGYIEIAMTRQDRSIPDTADRYRESILAHKPSNFTRSTEWQLSSDKRRLDFLISDVEIESPNPYPAGVVNISANHHVATRRSHMGYLVNTITASITMASNQPRSRAWQIFREIFASRTMHLQRKKIFVQSVTADEQLFSDTISFSVDYHILTADAARAMFSASHLFASLPTEWVYWNQSIAAIQGPRGTMQLAHNPLDDQIVDLCTDEFLPQQLPNYQIPPRYELPITQFCNPRPDPYESWLEFSGVLESLETTATVYQITLGEDDLKRTQFDPSSPVAANGQTEAAAGIERIVEQASAELGFVWQGRAIRVGYPIPKPDSLTFGGVELHRIGDGVFKHKQVGIVFCQPVYAATWRMHYVADERPAELPPEEADPLKEYYAEQARLLGEMQGAAQ